MADSCSNELSPPEYNSKMIFFIPFPFSLLCTGGKGAREKQGHPGIAFIPLRWLHGAQVTKHSLWAQHLALRLHRGIIQYVTSSRSQRLAKSAIFFPLSLNSRRAWEVNGDCTVSYPEVLAPASISWGNLELMYLSAGQISKGHALFSVE